MTWDDKNLAAVLVTCAACGRTFYMTNHQRLICVECEDKQARAALERGQPHRREG